MYRRLVKDSALYTVVAVLTRGLNLVLLPIYVRLLPQEEFGRFDLISALGPLMAAVFAFEVTQGVMRFVAEKQGDRPRQAELVSNAAIIAVVGYGLFVATVSAFSDSLSYLLFGSSAHTVLLIESAVLYTAIGFVYHWTVVSRALLRAKVAVTISGSSAVLASGLGLGLVLLREPDAESLVLGMAFGHSLVALGGLFYFRNYLHGPARWRVIRQLLCFSIPLVLSSTAFIMNTYVGRLIVNQFLGLESLAVYGFGARISAAVSILTVGLQGALAPLIYSELGDERTPARIGVLFRWYVVATLITVTVIWLSSDVLVRVMGGAEYADAGTVVVVLSLSVLVQASYLFFPGLYVAGRTATLALVHCAGLCVNVAVGLWLVGIMGLPGVAIATLSGSVVISVLNYRIARRYFRVPVRSPKPVA